MTIELNGPGYIRDMLLAIAKDRLILVSEISTPYLFSLETLPKDEPVPDKAVEKLVASLKNSSSVLYEKNKRRIEGIKKLPTDWKDRLKKKERRAKTEQEKQARIQEVLDVKRREQWLKKEVVVNKMVGEICVMLLDIGIRKAFDEIKDVPGSGSFEGVTKIVHNFENIRQYCESLSQSQRASFVKAVAAYESSIPVTPHEGSGMGPMGSTTSLQFLIPLLSKKYHDPVLDWVLRNTRSYRYYSTAPNIEAWRKYQRELPARKEKLKAEQKARRQKEKEAKEEERRRRTEAKAASFYDRQKSKHNPLLNGLRRIACDRNILVSELKGNAKGKFAQAISSLPEEKPVPTKVVKEIVQLLKTTAPALCGNSIENIPPLSHAWRSERKEKEKIALENYDDDQWEEYLVTLKNNKK